MSSQACLQTGTDSVTEGGKREQAMHQVEVGE